MHQISDVIALDAPGVVQLELWVSGSLDDVRVRLTPALALQAAEALVRAARAAMEK
jgi:hypothetical protein